VLFRHNAECREILCTQGRVSGIKLADGEVLPAEVVVFNGDAAALRQGLLGKNAQAAVPQAAGQRSLSAVTWSVLGKTRGLALDRHNLFFGNNYASEFDDIFSKQRLPRDPTLYVCAQDRGVDAGPQGAERLLCLVNAPALGDTELLTDEALESLKQATMQRARSCGLEIELDATRTVCTSPRHFHQRFPGTGGALYGQATHGWLSIFSRPGAICPVPGLYLAGGSVHPGPGVPMAAMSGRLAAEAVLENLGSTRRCQQEATFGGMSTP
jgi:1-hydroxycarotenoid 3,4-desaturase